MTSELCEKCPVGEYQPMDLQESCMKCKVNFTTEAEGKNSVSDCKCKEVFNLYIVNCKKIVIRI